MNIIKTLKDKLEIGGKPKSNITAEDFESDDNGDSGNSDESQDGDSEEFNENEKNESGDSGESNEDSEDENGESGSGDSDESNEESDEESTDGDSDSSDSNESNEESEDENGESGSGDSDESNEESDEESTDGDSDSSDSNESNEESEDESGSDDSDESNEESDNDDSNDSDNGESGSGDSDESDSTDKEVESMKNEMDSSSAERNMDYWFDGEGKEKIEDSFINQNFSDLIDERTDPVSDMEIRIGERDNRIENKRYGVSADEVKRQYDSRFANEIREAFRQIKTRESPKPAEYGQRVNVRGVIRKRNGDPTEERLYLEMDQAEVGDRCITVVVDCSSSMDELEVKLALMALADACEQIGDRFTATGYKTGSNTGDNPHTQLITSPTEQFNIEHLDSFYASGCTPTASGIKDGRSLADTTPNNEDVLIVITDGVANISLDGSNSSFSRSDKPIEQARTQVDTAISEGKRVIGVGVGPSLEDDYMQRIFGDSYVRTDMNDMAQTLVDIYKGQMKTTPR